MKRLITALSVILLVGCSIPLANFTMVSTRNHQMLITPQDTDKQVEGEHCVPVFFVRIGEPSPEKAVKSALESVGPEYKLIKSARFSHELNYFVIGNYCVKVVGTAIK